MRYTRLLGREAQVRLPISAANVLEDDGACAPCRGEDDGARAPYSGEDDEVKQPVREQQPDWAAVGPGDVGGLPSLAVLFAVVGSLRPSIRTAAAEQYRGRRHPAVVG